MEAVKQVLASAEDMWGFLGSMGFATKKSGRVSDTYGARAGLVPKPAESIPDLAEVQLTKSRFHIEADGAGIRSLTFDHADEALRNSWSNPEDTQANGP